VPDRFLYAAFESLGSRETRDAKRRIESNMDLSKKYLLSARIAPPRDDSRHRPTVLVHLKGKEVGSVPSLVEKLMNAAHVRKDRVCDRRLGGWCGRFFSFLLSSAVPSKPTARKNSGGRHSHRVRRERTDQASKTDRRAQQTQKIATTAASECALSIALILIAERGDKSTNASDDPWMEEEEIRDERRRLS